MTPRPPQHAAFLAALRRSPGDRVAWLVYADWLEEAGDPTGPFVRLSLELAEGRVPAADLEARAWQFDALHAAADPGTRDLLAEWRAGLPARFRVTDCFRIGHDPPQEMFGHARTVAVGTLETGRVARGVDLGVGVDSEGRPRRVQMIDAFQKNLDEAAAGRPPALVGLGWLGHLAIEAGDVLGDAS